MLLNELYLFVVKSIAQPHAKTFCTLKVTKANNIDFEQLHFYTWSPLEIFSHRRKKDNTGGRGKFFPQFLFDAYM